MNLKHKNISINVHTRIHDMYDLFVYHLIFWKIVDAGNTVCSEHYSHGKNSSKILTFYLLKEYDTISKEILERKPGKSNQNNVFQSLIT